MTRPLVAAACTDEARTMGRCTCGDVDPPEDVDTTQTAQQDAHDCRTAPECCPDCETHAGCRCDGDGPT